MKKILILPFILFSIGKATLVKAQTCHAGTITALYDTLCAGTRDSLTLSGNSSDTIQWQSSINDLSFINIPGVKDTTNYTTGLFLDSTHFYRVIVTDGNCMDTSKTIKLFVPPALLAQFSYTTQGSYVIFNSDSCKGNIVGYRWDFGDGDTSNLPNPIHFFAKDSTYDICLTIYDAFNCSYTFCMENGNFLGGGGGCYYPFVVYADSTTGVWNLYYTKSSFGPITYLWNWGDGTTSTDSIPYHRYTTAGRYNICLTMTDFGDCTSTFCDSIYLSKINLDSSAITIKTNYNPFLNTGINQVKFGSDNMSIYPNPCFSCEIKGVVNYNDIIVTDLLGRTINPSFTKTSGGYEINLPPNLNGIYFVKNIRTGQVVKFMKE